MAILYFSALFPSISFTSFWFFSSIRRNIAYDVDEKFENVVDKTKASFGSVITCAH